MHVQLINFLFTSARTEAPFEIDTAPMLAKLFAFSLVETISFNDC